MFGNKIFRNFFATILSTVLLGLFLGAYPVQSDSQTSTLVHYQGRLRDRTSGELVNGTRDFEFTIAGGAGQSFTYTANNTNVSNGLFEVEIDVNIDPLNPPYVDFDEPPYTLNIRVRNDSGSPWEDMGAETMTITKDVDNTGGNGPVDIMGPSLTLNFIICIQGFYPSRS